MTLAQLVQHLRCNVLRDDALPRLWSDTELVLYLNQAEKEFARRTHNIIDDSSALTTFDTVVGQAVYSLDPKILMVKQAGLVEYDETDPTLEVNYTRLRDRTRNQVRRRFAAGKPCTFTAQVRSHGMRLDPTPDDVFVIEMEVARLPLKTLISEKDVPEIDEEYHLSLCDYAAYRALNNNDPEGANMAAADKFRAIWDLTIRDVKRAMSVLRSGDTRQARANWTGKRLRY